VGRAQEAGGVRSFVMLSDSEASRTWDEVIGYCEHEIFAPYDGAQTDEI
jgi:hypothetical protein